MRYDAGIAAALQARKLIEESQKAQSLHVEWITPALADKAWQYLEKYADHNFSFTDCTSFAVCETLRLKEAFCFDLHFSVAGLSVVPAAAGG
ncbi:MAG TPA: hypothetical protein GX507_02560 [Clostridia bacterium]|nr:hypothetical protein [Clostridia bacterium]